MRETIWIAGIHFSQFLAWVIADDGFPAADLSPVAGFFAARWA